MSGRKVPSPGVIAIEDHMLAIAQDFRSLCEINLFRSHHRTMRRFEEALLQDIQKRSEDSQLNRISVTNEDYCSLPSVKPYRPESLKYLAVIEVCKSKLKVGGLTIILVNSITI